MSRKYRPQNATLLMFVIVIEMCLLRIEVLHFLQWWHFADFRKLCMLKTYTGRRNSLHTNESLAIAAYPIARPFHHLFLSNHLSKQ